MASEVGICNLAIGHLGGDATISNISPPDGSAEAGYCAQFYPIARNMMLESAEWGFATKRATLALLSDTPPPGFLYVYQMPSDCLNIIDLIDPNRPAFNAMPERDLHWQDDACWDTPVPYEAETRSDGSLIIYTNLQQAMVRYVALITDTTKYTSQCTDALAWLLASYVAGPLIKGDAGTAAAKTCYQAYVASLSAAKANDANNRRRSTAQSQRKAPWISSR